MFLAEKSHIINQIGTSLQLVQIRGYPSPYHMGVHKNKLRMNKLRFCLFDFIFSGWILLCHATMVVTRQINFSGKLNLQQLVLSSRYYDQWSKHGSMLIVIVYFENDCSLVALTLI